MADDALDDGTISRIARRAVGDENARLLDWRSEAVAYDAWLPGRTLTRVRGTARSSTGHRVVWSAILKTTDPPSITPGAAVEGGRREALAYRSGLLDDIPGGLKAARAFEVDLTEGGGVRLWLEDVVDDFDERWPLEQYRQVARHLGRFNAASLAGGGLQAPPWLKGGWAEYHSAPATIPEALLEVESLSRDERVDRAFGTDISAPAARLLKDQERFIELLADLPQALCHHDAQRANLFARRHNDGSTETIAIDWESIGPGAVGAEIATLVSGTIGRGDWPAERASELDSEVFAGYVEGLRDADWAGDENVVRLGYAAGLALRWWRLRATLRALTDPEVPAVLGRARDVPRREALLSFVSFARYLLDRADEARELAGRRGFSPGSSRSRAAARPPGAGMSRA
jgi:hypothetical protein